MKRYLFLTLVFSIAILAGCSEDSIMNSNGPAEQAEQGANLSTEDRRMDGNTILDIAAANDDFSVLVDAVKFAGLERALSSNRQLTVFAPKNQAFIDLLATLGISAADLFVPANKDLVTTILLYHIVKKERFADKVLSENRLYTLTKEYAYIRTDAGAQIGNSKYGFANIVGTDIDASNGVIHVLDRVILPKKLELGIGPESSKSTILEIAAGNDDFSILADAVGFAGLGDALNGEGQLTVFAPTNQAFLDLLTALNISAEDLFVEENKNLITKILLYHVAGGELFAEDVLSVRKIRTLAEEKDFVKLENGPQIGNKKYGFANIIGTDIDAKNGVVHILDKVIIPASTELDLRKPENGKTIFDIAASLEDFSVLAQAVQFAGLEGALSGKDQLTVFAPNNEAFGKLLNKLNLTPQQLFVEENKALVTEILLYHVAAGERFAKEVLSSWRIKMLSGEKAWVLRWGGPRIGNFRKGFAKIIATDIDASNGVIHVLDEVLLPPNLKL